MKVAFSCRQGVVCAKIWQYLLYFLPKDRLNHENSDTLMYNVPIDKLESRGSL